MEQQSIINYSEAIKAIKSAILQSRYRAAALANREMLSLYFGIGKFISGNSRGNFWGTNAIEVISQQLQQELPGLRGFSATSLKRMRTFYEGWSNVLLNRPQPVDEISVLNRPPSVDEIQCFENKDVVIRPLAMGELIIDEKLLLSEIRQMPTAEFNWECFLQIGFIHH